MGAKAMTPNRVLSCVLIGGFSDVVDRASCPLDPLPAGRLGVWALAGRQLRQPDGHHRDHPGSRPRRDPAPGRSMMRLFGTLGLAAVLQAGTPAWAEVPPPP